MTATDTPRALTFYCRDIRSWGEFDEAISKLDRNWIYRGQPDDYPLTTSIERALLRWGIPLQTAPSIEYQTIREFRRRLREPEHHRVHEDTLYCLSLMQHHGAPTRLLDCTYSPFVAASFAMQDGVLPLNRDQRTPTPVIWCFNGKWLDEAQTATTARFLRGRRQVDQLRGDCTFLPLYKMEVSDLYAGSRDKFVYHENALALNERLTIQQGVFLCPGDLAASFIENIKEMSDWDQVTNIRKLRFTFAATEAAQFVERLRRMNLGFAALFPSLDGFAKSIGQHIVHYRKQADERAGLIP